ncbi:MAG: hypothetical protein KDE47_24245, partial [Caldilineaceae bacterium]|nr:hypothetical protein [Caldilineaceae bacterium]
CNMDAAVDAGDISAVVMEIFDGDGTGVGTVAGGTFAGGPGCDANQDTVINAADISCTVLLIFNGPNSCSALASGASRPAAQLAIRNTHVDLAKEAATVEILLTGGAGQVSALTFVIDYDATQLWFDANDSDGDGLPDAVSLPTATGERLVDLTDRGGQLAIALADISAVPTGFADGIVLTLTFGVKHPVGNDTVTSELTFRREEPASLGRTNGASLAVNAHDGILTITPITVVSQLYLPLVQVDVTTTAANTPK